MRLRNFGRAIWFEMLALFVLASLVPPPQLRLGAAEAIELPGEAPILETDRDHWSFQPLANPIVPNIDGDDWSRNSIDRFVLDHLRRKELRPADEASRTVLLRRLSYDLTGLPPTPVEMEAFSNDPSPDAYERLVDRLLESPAYGEKWAQHWLDLARFAETDGFEHDLVRPNAWQYRDWVIEALNRDLPYDQFVMLQLAADEIASQDEFAQRAIGFCLAGPDMPDINSQDERRHFLLNDLTSTVASVFLGLQFGCAQCHDHKYDPISIGDFYRLRAYFDPTLSLRRDKPASMIESPAAREPVISRVFLRGDWRNPGPEVVPAFPRIATLASDSLPPPGTSPGSRTSLARWLTQPDHPLTTRVIVNRLWQHHFGHGLSQNPSDFGVMGDEPRHPELLDWLARELVRRRWSMKEMQRLIVTSSTYRQASGPFPDSDPKNRYLSRFPRKRLTGEELRDAMFAASDSLNFAAGGPGVRPPLPTELTRTLLRDQWKVAEREADHYRRSIYVFARRNLRYPVFEVFDRPDANASCPDRTRSTTAIQSLHLLNSQMALDAARRLAGSVLSTAKTRPEQIEMAFLRVLNRHPEPSELEELSAFVEQQATLLVAESRAGTLAVPIPPTDSVSPHDAAAMVDLCLAMWNLNEFLYVD